MEGLELQCFQIISAVGAARSTYIEAIQEAKKGNFEKARGLVVEGEETFNQGHSAHAKLIQMEANGEAVGGSLLLIHAEDQLMSAEAFKIIASEFIETHEKIAALEARIKD